MHQAAAYLAGMGGQIPGPLGIAVGGHTFGLKPCETKRPKPGTTKTYGNKVPPTRNTHLPLAELRITHSQTNLHTSGVAGALGYTVRMPQRRLWTVMYQPLRPQSTSVRASEKSSTRKRAIAKALQLNGHSDFAPLDLAYYQHLLFVCLLYTSPSPRDGLLSRMPSSA